MDNDPHPALDGATTALHKRIEELEAELESKTCESFSWESDYRGLEDKCRERDDKFEAAESEVARLREELETLRLAVEAGRLLIATERAAREKAEANYRFMVERAADEKLDGYREMAQKAADAERERDTALARVKELEAMAQRWEQALRHADAEHLKHGATAGCDHCDHEDK